MWPDVDFGGAPVVVTGANGFIGRRLVAGLSACNANVTVLLRSGHGRRYFEACGANAIICKLTAGAELNEALRDQRVLFHFAYDVRASGADNLAAFSALSDAPANNGIERIVHASSIVVYDDWPHGHITETSPISTAAGGEYRQSKIAMETALLNGNIPSAILQPTIVYGPGSALWTEAPIAALRRGPIILPDPPGICPAVYVDDVVAGALQAAALPDLGQERFILSGPDRITWANLYEAYAEGIGAGSVQLVPLDELRSRIPPAQDNSAPQGPSLSARLSKKLRHLIGNHRFDQITSAVRARLAPRGPVLPDPHLLDLYSATPTISCETARTRLNYHPHYDLATGMKALRSISNRR